MVGVVGKNVQLETPDNRKLHIDCGRSVESTIGIRAWSAGARRGGCSGFGRRSAKEEVQGPLTLVERLEAIDHGIRPLELAALLGVGKTTLYDWIAAGTIPAYRHRGVVFFDPAMIAAWLRRQSTQGR
jgi:excisionase family DNA binding protein